MKLEVPNVPPSGNELRRKYRTLFAYRDLRMKWEKDLTFSTKGADETIAFKKQAANGAKLAVTIRVYRRRELDRDNFVGGAKPVVDALVNIGYLRNDSPDRVTVTYLQASPFKPRTVIEITPEET